jgi:hypothetical protein
MKFDKCKAWIIDPKKQTITTNDIDVGDSWDHIRDIIGCKYLEYIPLHAVPPLVALCDEEGRLKSGKKNYFHYRWFGHMTEFSDSCSLACINDIEMKQRLPVHELTFCGTVVFFGYSSADGELRDTQMNLKDMLEGVDMCDADYVDEPRMEFIPLDNSDLH